jgi:DNA-directed RNA polymerase subunit RPC12/RpoP
MVTVVSTVPHPSVVKEVVCKNCGATLQYTPNDIKEGKSYDYTGSFDMVYSIKCPPCGNDVFVKRH